MEKVTGLEAEWNGISGFDSWNDKIEALMDEVVDHLEYEEVDEAKAVMARLAYAMTRLDSAMRYGTDDVLNAKSAWKSYRELETECRYSSDYSKS